MKDKIEEILKGVYQVGFQKISSYDGNYKDITLDMYVDDLSTLIQQERKDAVEGFVREFNNKCLHDSINDSYNYPLEEVPNVVYNFMDTYLSSIGKDGE